MSVAPEDAAADDLRGVLLDDALLALELEQKNAAHGRAARDWATCGRLGGRPRKGPYEPAW